MDDNKVYEILINYIQDDNKWKMEVSNRLSSIEAQTKATNGRVLKVEGEIVRINDDLFLIKKGSEKDVIVQKVNWKWITAIGAGFVFILDLIVILLIDWVKKNWIN